MKTRKWILALMVLILLVFLSSCEKKTAEMHDGYYTAEAAEFDEYGWKDFVTIYVSANKILTVEYNSFNKSGFVKSWDLNYMRTMSLASGTYPNEFTRIYSVALINWQDPDAVDVVSGATESHSSFVQLSHAAIERAMTGDKQVARVSLLENLTVTEG